MGSGVTTQDASDVADYTVDWTQWLDGDTIATSDFSVSAGMTIESQSNNATSGTVVLSGGTAGNNYTVTHSITTAGSLEAQRSFVVRVREL